MTFRQFSAKPEAIPTAASWYLADLGEARGKQELFTRQTPQRLKVLREYALIESAVSSNRIEGVEVDQARVRTIVLGKSELKDRDEEEVRGYRDALKLIHEEGARLPVSEETILRLHQFCRGRIWDAGKYKEKDGDIVEKYADGKERVRFKPVEAVRTAESLRELVGLWEKCREERWVHSLIALAAFNLDFLCIHPFRDGNGRVSRLVLLLQSYHAGYEVGRYIGLERLIEENKDRYYETLEESSRGWHEGKHDPWPYINYLHYILKTAYREFEDRIGQVASPKGAKAEAVISAIKKQSGEFRIMDIERQCPGVGREWIKVILGKMKKSGEITCLGKGPAARWRYKGSTPK